VIPQPVVPCRNQSRRFSASR